MRRIFWIGSPFFQASFKTSFAADVQVHFFNFEEIKVFTWTDLVAMAGYEPDVVVVADKSRPPFVLGIENFPCVTVFYAVDSHVHSWYPFYAQAFDVCLVSLHDHQEFFKHKRLPQERVIWCPAFAKDSDAPDYSVQPIWDCLFVGNVNAETLPKRVQFLKELKNYIPTLHITRGAYAQLFPQAKVVVNHCENEDLNFRVFEALGCGACLVTPQIGHGLNSLFVDGQELITYELNNAKSAANSIEYLLNNQDLRNNIARQGLAKIDAKHRAVHRAKLLVDILNDNDWDKIIAQRLSHAKLIRNTWLRQIYLLFADALSDEKLRKAYVEAASGKI